MALIMGREIIIGRYYKIVVFTEHEEYHFNELDCHQTLMLSSLCDDQDLKYSWEMRPYKRPPWQELSVDG